MAGGNTGAGAALVVVVVGGGVVAMICFASVSDIRKLASLLS